MFGLTGCMQCAAVMTHLPLMTVAPQNGLLLPLSTSAAIQGNSFLAAGPPNTMRSWIRHCSKILQQQCYFFCRNIRWVLTWSGLLARPHWQVEGEAPPPPFDWLPPPCSHTLGPAILLALGVLESTAPPYFSQQLPRRSPPEPKVKTAHPG